MRRLHQKKKTTRRIIIYLCQYLVPHIHNRTQRLRIQALRICSLGGFAALFQLIASVRFRQTVLRAEFRATIRTISDNRRRALHAPFRSTFALAFASSSSSSSSRFNISFRFSFTHIYRISHIRSFNSSIVRYNRYNSDTAIQRYSNRT